MIKKRHKIIKIIYAYIRKYVIKKGLFNITNLTHILKNFNLEFILIAVCNT
jgi:hypothetical protein